MTGGEVLSGTGVDSCTKRYVIYYVSLWADHLASRGNNLFQVHLLLIELLKPIILLQIIINLNYS